MATPAQILKNQFPTIAIVGRVNVGKSSLFNNLTEHSQAIVSTIAGSTRNNNEGIAHWRGLYLNVIDTGGLTFRDDIPLEEDIIKQTEFAIERADLILFLTDASTGVLPQELELSKKIISQKEKIILVANKVDSEKVEPNIYDKEYQALQLGTPFPISAASGRNVGDLLDTIFERLETLGTPVRKDNVRPEKATIQVSLMGKPNVGKSSLFNKLIGEERVIVSDLAHTTREPYDTLLTYKYEHSFVEFTEEEGEVVKTEEIEQKINFIDTAGIRRKNRVKGFLEKMGVVKSFQTVMKSEIMLFVLDATEPIAQQDMQLGGYLEKHGKSAIILINKWDLAEDNSDAGRRQMEKVVRSYFPHLDFAPILFVSGKTGFRVHQIFPLIMEVWEARRTKIGVKALEYFLKQTTRKHLPSKGKGTRQPKLLGIRQVGLVPPIFEIAVKYRTSLHRSYINYIENRMREKWNFIGTPIIIRLRKTKR